MVVFVVLILQYILKRNVVRGKISWLLRKVDVEEKMGLVVIYKRMWSFKKKFSDFVVIQFGKNVDNFNMNLIERVRILVVC